MVGRYYKPSSIFIDNTIAYRQEIVMLSFEVDGQTVEPSKATIRSEYDGRTIELTDNDEDATILIAESSEDGQDGLCTLSNGLLACFTDNDMESKVQTLYGFELLSIEVDGRTYSSFTTRDDVTVSFSVSTGQYRDGVVKPSQSVITDGIENTEECISGWFKLQDNLFSPDAVTLQMENESTPRTLRQEQTATGFVLGYGDLAELSANAKLSIGDLVFEANNDVAANALNELKGFTLLSLEIGGQTYTKFTYS